MLTKKELKPLLLMLIKDEGYVTYPYDDATGKRVKAPIGNTTIGIGINLDEGITFDEAEYLCIKRIRAIERELSRLPFYDSLDIVRKYVIINLSFNLGVKGMMGFKKMLAHIENANYKIASDELLNSKAARQLPNRYNRLAKIMTTGKF